MPVCLDVSVRHINTYKFQCSARTSRLANALVKAMVTVTATAMVGVTEEATASQASPSPVEVVVCQEVSPFPAETTQARLNQPAVPLEEASPSQAETRLAVALLAADSPVETTLDKLLVVAFRAVTTQARFQAHLNLLADFLDFLEAHLVKLLVLQCRRVVSLVVMLPALLAALQTVVFRALQAVHRMAMLPAIQAVTHQPLRLL
jgi:hypothetical protein